MSGAPSIWATAIKLVATAVDHPRLPAADALSIRAFLRLYDQYATEIKECAYQFVAQDTVTTELINPVSLKFCVDAEWLEATISLSFIDRVTSVDTLIEHRLRSYLASKAIESKQVVTLVKLDDIVSQELCINMREGNAN